MRKAQSVETLLRRSLGKEAANALLAKIDRMVAGGAKKDAIEKAVTAELQRQFVQQVVSAVLSEISPVTPVTVQGVQAKVRPVVRGVVARTPAISRGVHAAPGRRPGRTSKVGR